MNYAAVSHPATHKNKYKKCIDLCKKYAKDNGVYPKWGLKLCKGFCVAIESGGCVKIEEQCDCQQGDLAPATCFCTFNSMC